MSSVLSSPGMPGASVPTGPRPAVTPLPGKNSFKKEKTWITLKGSMQPVLGYDAVKDPFLASFFGNHSLQRQLIRSGWYEENGVCRLCRRRGGCVKVCENCYSVYHGACLPPSPKMTARGLRVLILHGCPDVSNVSQTLMSTEFFGEVHAFDYNKYFLPPGPSPLDPFDAILVVNGSGSWRDTDGLGNSLAEYVDRGGGVVLVGLTAQELPQGRFMREGYIPLYLDGEKTGRNLTLVVPDTPSFVSTGPPPGARRNPARDRDMNLDITKNTVRLVQQLTRTPHPLLEGVNRFDGGGMSFHARASATDKASVVANWSDGEPLVAVLDKHPGAPRGRVTQLNFHPFSNAASSSAENDDNNDEDNKKGDPDNWDSTTDGGLLLGNSLRFTAFPTYHHTTGFFMCPDCDGRQSDSNPHTLGNSTKNSNNRTQSSKPPPSSNQEDAAVAATSPSVSAALGDLLSQTKAASIKEVLDAKLVVDRAILKHVLELIPSTWGGGAPKEPLNPSEVKYLRYLYYRKFRVDRKLSESQKMSPRVARLHPHGDGPSNDAHTTAHRALDLDPNRLGRGKPAKFIVDVDTAGKDKVDGLRKPSKGRTGLPPMKSGANSQGNSRAPSRENSQNKKGENNAE